MANAPSLEELWEAAPPAAKKFDPGQIAGLPEAARRYLEHAIAPGTPLASSVRLRMHGDIKLKGWIPFTAEQVIRWEQGMIWRATVRMHGIPIRGFDRLFNGQGAMQWKILGLIPLVTAVGSDITRSAAGRVAAETVWLPSVLCREDVTWTEKDALHAVAGLSVAGQRVKMEIAVDEAGQLESVRLQRWGNPEGAAFHYADFGGVAEWESTFKGYTIPTKLRIGWYPGTERFAAEGECFRCTIDLAAFR